MQGMALTTLAAAAFALPALAATNPPAFKYHGFQGEGAGYVPFQEDRGPAIMPTAAQLDAVQALDATVRFGHNGTPKVITRTAAYLSAPRAGAPEAVAMAWLQENAALFGMTPAEFADMELLRVSPLHESPDHKLMAQGLPPSTTDVPHVVLFRQILGGVTVGSREGMVNVSLTRDGRVAFVGSTLTRQKQYTNSRQLSEVAALRAAAADVNMNLGALQPVENPLNDFLTYSSSILADVQRVRPRALPTADGLRHVWEVTLLDSEHTDDRGHPQGFISHVDAETGRVWVRDNALQHLGELPAWRVFPNQPNDPRNPNTDASEDTREHWCWGVTDEDEMDDGDAGRDPEECQGPELRDMLGRAPWDTLHTATPTFTTHGNNASTAVSQVVFIAPDTVVQRPVDPLRNYNFSFTNSWMTSACDPTAHLRPDLNFNDFEAATLNLFAMHNRMHDWAYLLGWTEVNSNLQFNNFGNTDETRENDGELGQSQAGRLTINGRDNANQLTLQDGIPGITNQYLWQSLPGIIYPAACADGAYDMGIIAHEYTHATSNRMTGGPDGSLGGGQSGNMGEAWSDLVGIEMLQAFGLTPISNESPYTLAVYITGDPEAGIRNYNISDSPLNFSDLQYDGSGLTSPHADSEVWGAVMHKVRQALIDKYQARYPFENREMQIECAEGFRGSHGCPGNRRWVQMMYDGFLIQPAGPSMLDARDAILASDLLRYEGDNQAEMWNAFALGGMGAKAFSAGSGDIDPRADFSSPLREDEAQVTFHALAPDGSEPEANIYVGHYEARVTPIADTNPRGGFSRNHNFVPGTYEFIVQAKGYGLTRFTTTFESGEVRDWVMELRPNLASLHRGAKASGDGDSEEELLELIDDTESTQWESSDRALAEGKAEGAFVEGRQVTVQLSERALVTDINVSAALLGGSRFTALRSFDIAACDAAVKNCSTDAGFSVIYQSADDAFNGRYLRPKAPHLKVQNFDLPDTEATHMRIIVRDSQCTGGPDFQREVHPSGDPGNDPDCDTGSNLQLMALSAQNATLPPTDLPDDLFPPSNTPWTVRIAELQVFGQTTEVAVSPRDQPTAAARSSVTRGGALGFGLVLLGLLGLRRRR